MTRVFKVLLINSDPDDYIITRDLLGEVSGLCYEVHWEPTCSGALKEIASGSYDVCLVDFLIGELEGLELIRRVKNSMPGFPLILLTARVDDHMMDAVMEAGAADYLIKGEITSHSLDQAIRRQLRAAPTFRCPKSPTPSITVTFFRSRWLYTMKQRVLENLDEGGYRNKPIVRM